MGGRTTETEMMCADTYQYMDMYMYKSDEANGCQR